jgi:hypothetical protein
MARLKMSCRKRLADVFGIRAHLSRGADGLVFQPLSVIG